MKKVQHGITITKWNHTVIAGLWLTGPYATEKFSIAVKSKKQATKLFNYLKRFANQ